MKKIFFYSLLIICIILVFILALPKYFNSQNQRYLQTAIQKIEHTSRGIVSIKIVSETNGWFQSQTQLRIICHADHQHEITFNGKLTSLYGPILFTSHGLYFGRAYLQLQLHNNSLTKPYFLEPLLNSQVLIDFNGNQKLQLAGLNTKLHPKPSWTFAGLKGNFFLNANLTHMSGKITGGTLEFYIDNSKFTVAPFAQTFDFSRPNKQTIWTGSKKLTFPQISVQRGLIDNQFKHITLQSLVEKKHQFANNKLDVTIKQFNVSGQTGHFNATIALNRLNLPALISIQHYLNQMLTQTHTNQSPIFDKKQHQILKNKVITLLQHSIGYFNGRLTLTGLGSMNLDTGYDNSHPDSRFHFIIKVIKNQRTIAAIQFKLSGLNKKYFIRALFNANKLTANKMLAYAITPNFKSSLTILAPDTKPTNSFYLLKAKLFVNPSSKNNLSLMDNTNRLQFQANWNIPAYLLELFPRLMPILITQIEDAKEQQQTIIIYKYIQQILPWLIQQGYLKKEGNFYHSNWHFNLQQGLQINGSSFEQLQQQWQQYQLQQMHQQIKETNKVPSVFHNIIMPKQ